MPSSNKSFLQLVAVIYILVPLALGAQVQPMDLGFMNDAISEPSGLAMHYNTGNHHFEIWAHNDHKYPDSIYSIRLDDLDTFSRYLDLDVPYYDWEDMTRDDQGNLYIGDFGNWTPAAEDQIIKIADPNGYSTHFPATETIKFTVPAVGNLESEAMFYFQDSLYIIIKNIHNDPDLTEGVTYVYRIPDHPHVGGGEHVAILHDSLQTLLPGDPVPGEVRITGADISPDKKVLTLLGYSRIWVFSCFQGSDFFSGTTHYFSIQPRQYEGIAFKNNHEVYISKEGADDNPNYNPKMFYLDLSPYIDGACQDCEKAINTTFDQGLDHGWYLFTAGTGAGQFDVSQGVAEVDISAVGMYRWHVNLRQKGVNLQMGKSFRVTFSAWTNQTDHSLSVILNNLSGSTGYAYHLQPITTTATNYSFDFAMEKPTDINSVFSFNLGNDAVQKIYLDDLSIQASSCYCPDTLALGAPILDTEVDLQASHSITVGSALINSSLSLRAGDHICADPGLEVGLGDVLTFEIDGCE